MEATEKSKQDFAKKLKIEIRAFISVFDAEYRKKLVTAICCDFGKTTGLGNDNQDWHTGYKVKYNQIRALVNKAFDGNFEKQLYECCGMSGNETVDWFIIKELKNGSN